MDEMRRQNVKLLLVEPYFDLKTPNAIARDTGARVLVAPPSVGGEGSIRTYFDLFDHNVTLIAGAAQQLSVRHQAQP
jgi:ABC-type Zn uptake system ZnuABC Zn-binding protein ZnuA